MAVSLPAGSMPVAATLGRRLAEAWAAQADAIVLVEGDRRITGRAAEIETRRWAAELAASGARRGTHVAFLARPGAAHATAWVGAVRLGAIATSLHLLETDDKLAEALGWLDADILACDPDLAERAAGIAARCGRPVRIVRLASGNGGDVPPVDLDRGEGDDPVAIALSSGTTGRPKGVLHTHRTLIASAEAGPLLYPGLGPADRMLIAVGTSFGAWLNLVPPAVAAGAALVFQPRFEPAACLALLAAERVTILPLVPAMFRALLAAGPERLDLSALRLAFASGEAPTSADVAAIRARITDRVRAAYLSTEGGCACGVVADEADYDAAGTVPGGRPLPGSFARVIRPGEAFGQAGEIALAGPSLAPGYWLEPDLTRKRFRDGWWMSGDIGETSPAGGLIVTGRTDNVINSGGVKVQAEEVELALASHPGVRQACVVGVPDPRWGQRVEAFVVAADPALSAETLLAWCRERDVLAAVKLPKRVHFRDTLPTGATGKLYRRAILAELEEVR